MRCRRSSRYCRRLSWRYGTRRHKSGLLLTVCTVQGGKSREKANPDTGKRRVCAKQDIRPARAVRFYPAVYHNPLPERKNV